MIIIKKRLFITPSEENLCESFKEMFLGHFCEEPKDGGKRDAHFKGADGLWRIEEAESIDKDKSKYKYISYGLKYSYITGLDDDAVDIPNSSFEVVYLDSEFPYEVMMALCAYLTKRYPEVTIYQMNMDRMQTIAEITHAEIEYSKSEE